MARFNAPKKQFSPTTYLPVVLLILVLGGFVLFSGSFSRSNLAHEKEILEKAINRSVTQCYALEGNYPASLTYLEDNYGLTYNEEHFFVDYRYIGGNLRPDITIIERE